MASMPVSRATNAYDLLGEVIDLILEEPLRYDQTNTLITQDGRAKGLLGFNSSFAYPTFPHCGTIGCVAGWIVALKAPSIVRDVMDYAERILGLSQEQGWLLFTPAAACGIKPQTTGHAEAGAAHIQRFREKHISQLLAKKV